MVNKVTPEKLTKYHLLPHQVFVYGSNESGINGAGAAYFAYKELNAVNGIGFGPSGQCFAIPTKDWNIMTLDLNTISFYIKRFNLYVKSHPELEFFITKIGCGLANYTPDDIAPLFKEMYSLPNVYFPQEFWDWYNKNNTK